MVCASDIHNTQPRMRQEWMCKMPPLTYVHDPAEYRCVVHSAAVPPPLPELVLALLDARLCAFTDVHHVVLVELAQLLLALRQTRELAAKRLCAYDVHLRPLDRVHGQRPAQIKVKLENSEYSFSTQLSSCALKLKVKPCTLLHIMMRIFFFFKSDHPK